MADRTDRAFGALADPVAVEHTALGVVSVVTVSDAYTVDARQKKKTFSL
jgi:hypothetical protein